MGNDISKEAAVFIVCAEEATDSSATLVPSYQTPQHHIPAHTTLTPHQRSYNICFQITICTA